MHAGRSEPVRGVRAAAARAINPSSRERFLSRVEPRPIDVSKDPMTEERVDRLLGVKQIAALTGVSIYTIHAWVREGLFPKGFKLGPNATRWRARDYNEWVEQQRVKKGE